ncbi:MAG TPA: hypothetical protein VJ461_06655 [Candidatus Nanoarchaeia archaeon]|nr:hypothetical protein [Candidatus Nanoarchaeia archaeon]
MDKKKSLDVLLNSHQINCLGTDWRGNPVFDKEDAEPVIVLVHKFGNARPLCRYFLMNKHYPEPSCNARDEDKSKGYCPYRID